MRVRTISLGIAAAGVAAAIVAFATLDTPAPPRPTAAHAAEAGPPPAMAVPVVAVARKPVPVYLEYVASADAIRTVTLQAKVTGYLMAGSVTDGADVKQGDLLYRIDPRDYQAALDQAKAQETRDVAQREYNQANAHRNEVLSKNGDVSVDTYQQSASTLHQVEASIAADRAAIETAALNLGYTEIQAPFTGRLSRTQVHEGALISAAGTQINTLVQLDPIYVTFNPPETDLAAITQAQARGPVPTEAMIGSDPTPHFSGTLTFLDNTVDRTTGTITARATIANPAKILLPGQYARVRLKVGEQADALLIPQIAIGSSQMGRFVYVVGPDNKAAQRMVILGRSVGELVVVEKGLNDGESVIVGDLQKLRPGAPVKPEKAAGAP